MLLSKIRELCKRKNITISELERYLNLGNGTIRKWDSSQPSINKIKMVADYFKIKVDDLLENELHIPSEEAQNIALKFDSLSEKQKSLVRCYLSIIEKEAG